MDRKRIIICACALIVLSVMAPTAEAAIIVVTPQRLFQPHFEITFKGSNIFVKNIGDANATNVHVRRTFDGGFIVLGKDKTVSFSNIAVGETKEAKMGMILGLGSTIITVSVSCDEGVNVSSSVPAKILLFFIKIMQTLCFCYY